MTDFKVGGNYQTRDGKPVRIYATDCGGDYPIHGAMLLSDDWSVACWLPDGTFGIGSKFDIVTPKTYGEMTCEEKLALHEANHSGQDIEVYLGCWWVLTEPDFLPHLAYRIRPRG